jgi:galactokinase
MSEEFWLEEATQVCLLCSFVTTYSIPIFMLCTYMYLAVIIVTEFRNCALLGADMESMTLKDGDAMFEIRDVVADSGAVQQNVFTVDAVKTLESYRRIDETKDFLCNREREWLIRSNVKIVVSDAVAVAFRAAELANIPSVCLSNFTWDFIYKSFNIISDSYSAMLARLQDDYHLATLYIRLPGSCDCSTEMEKISLDIPMIVRLHRRASQEVRGELGIAEGVKICLVMLGGHDVGIDHFSISKMSLPENWVCLVTQTVASGEISKDLPSNMKIIPASAYMPDYISCADVVIGKIGYGTVSECIAHKTPLVFVRRQNFAEEERLIELLSCHEAGIEISLDVFISGNFKHVVETASHLVIKNCHTHGAETAANLICDLAKIYQGILHSSRNGSVSVSYLRKTSYCQFFKQYLSCRSGQNIPMLESPELFVAHNLVHIARAPGRLDVLGGIADYSGSHALELPLSCGTFVATQLQYFEGTSRPGQSVVIRIYSPTDDNDRSDFISFNLDDVFMVENDGLLKTKEFELVHKYFSQDERNKWAAYIIGALNVISQVKSVKFPPNLGSIAILVGSHGIREGAGISSSAAVEVASIMSIGSALGLSFEDFEVPILAQQVENHIVGACCGIMDQLTSYFGRPNKFVSLRCTEPFKFLGYIDMPHNITFWGIDTGVKRSTSSLKYTVCRVGAFMGLKIISKRRNERRETPISCLTDLSPLEFEEKYKEILPECILGSEFLNAYGPHGDCLTTIDSAVKYAVRQSTSHPIFENHRVKVFADMLSSCKGELSVEECYSLGEMMYSSHRSYSECGLGSPETDVIVRAAQSIRGPVYGAKITGGGCGGTVCVCTSNDEKGAAAIEAIMQVYLKETGEAVRGVYFGSSQGAETFGAMSFLS